MEIIEKQVEKVKEVPADNYGYNYGRRDINGKANAGLTLGIIGGGQIKFNLPLTNKRLVLNMSDLEAFKETLITKN